MIFLLRSCLKKFKDLGLFENFIVKQLRKSLESNWNIGSMRQLLFSSSIIDFDDVTNATSYNELWEQTLNELEPDVKMLALHNLKLPLEKEMYMRSKNQGEYEKQRFENRDKPDKVMLEGICHNCHVTSEKLTIRHHTFDNVGLQAFISNLITADIRAREPQYLRHRNNGSPVNCFSAEIGKKLPYNACFIYNT